MDEYMYKWTETYLLNEWSEDNIFIRLGKFVLTLGGTQDNYIGIYHILHPVSERDAAAWEF